MRKFVKKIVGFMHFFLDPERLYLVPVPQVPRLSALDRYMSKRK